MRAGRQQCDLSAYQRQGRKITALKFKMRRVVMLPEAGAVQIKMFPDLEDMPAVVAELKAAGLSTSDAWEIWQKGWLILDSRGLCDEQLNERMK